MLLFLTDSREPDGAGGEDASRAAVRSASGHALHDVNLVSLAQGDAVVERIKFKAHTETDAPRNISLKILP